MSEPISHEDVPVDIPADHAPVNVRIVEDSTQGQNEPEKAPRHLDTRTVTFFDLSTVNGDPMIQIATKNVKRANMVIHALAANVDVIYLCDRPMPNPTVSNSVFVLEKGEELTVTSSHQIYAYGTAGDKITVWEETYDR